MENDCDRKNTRCLYDGDISSFLGEERNSIFGLLNGSYHGDTLTTTRDAWIGEIDILQHVLIPWKDMGGRILFEYDIPRLGNLKPLKYYEYISLNCHTDAMRMATLIQINLMT